MRPHLTEPVLFNTMKSNDRTEAGIIAIVGPWSPGGRGVCLAPLREAIASIRRGLACLRHQRRINETL